MADFKKGDKLKIKDLGDTDSYWYESGEIYTFDHYLSARKGGRGIVTEELIAEGYISDDVWIGEDDVEPCQNELQDVLASGDTEVPDIIGNGPNELTEALNAVDEMFKELMFEVVKNNAADGINAIVDYCHNESAVKGWWTAKDGSHLKDNPLTFSNKLMLIVSEIAEAMEGDRKDSMDDHLPHRKMAEVELADAVIRIFDLAGAYDYDLGGAVVEKMNYNKVRADHTKEARSEANGKRY